MTTRSISKGGGARRLALWSGLILASWLLSPMFFAQHLEGYTANLKSIALMANRGNAMGQDLVLTALTDFNYFTRPAMIGLLQVGDRIWGGGGDWYFRALLILSFAIVFGSSILIAHRLGYVRTWSAALSLLLVPGVSENAFFFNDSMPSAAFAVGAMALVTVWDKPVAFLLAGGLVAGSVLCRLDGILLAPAIGGVAWLRHNSFRSLAPRAFAAATGFIIGLTIGALLFKATFVDALIVARTFYPDPPYIVTLRTSLLFFGASGTLILAVGLFASLGGLRTSTAPLRHLIVFLVHPLLIGIAVLKLSSETRYVYPLLTPYIALYGARGIDTLVKGVRGRHRPISLAGLLALLLFAMVPPPIITVRDGPRALVGRLWMPALWWRWENTQAESLQRVDAVVAIAERTPRLLLISTHWNDDQFVKQRLLAAGYRPRSAEAVFPRCSGFSVYVKGPHVVAHIRTERQHWQVRTSKTRLRALLLERSLSCTALLRFERAYLTLWGPDGRVNGFTDTIDPRLLGSILPRLGSPPALSAPFTPRSLFLAPFWRVQNADGSVPRHQLEGMFHAYPLSRLELTIIHRDAETYLRLPLQDIPGDDDRIIAFEDFRLAYQPRCKDPKSARLSDLPLCNHSPRITWIPTCHAIKPGVLLPNTPCRRRPVPVP